MVCLFINRATKTPHHNFVGYIITFSCSLSFLSGQNTLSSLLPEFSLGVA